MPPMTNLKRNYFLHENPLGGYFCFIGNYKSLRIFATLQITGSYITIYTTDALQSIDPSNEWFFMAWAVFTTISWVEYANIRAAKQI